MKFRFILEQLPKLNVSTMKALSTFFILLSTFFAISAQEAYVTLWNTANDGISADNQITFGATGEFDYTWVDESNPNNAGGGSSNGGTTITFPTSGIYELSITPTGDNPFSKLSFGELSVSTDSQKLMEIRNWGNVAWSSFQYAYPYTLNLIITATDIPDLSNVTDMSYAFAFSGIDTVPNLNDWDVGNIVSMRGMFFGSPFNQYIGNWDVSSVADMHRMFSVAFNFDQPIGNWDVSSVTDMGTMFWNSGFNHPIAGWNLNNLETAEAMFSTSAMNCENYSLTLQGWANNSNTPTGINFANNGMEYSPNVVDDRAYLINALYWTITGDELGECFIPTSVDEYNAERLRVYPNPTKGTVFIEPLQNATLSLYDLQGRRVLQFEMSDFDSDFRLSLDPLDQGVYLLRVEADKFRAATRIVKL